MGEGSAEPVPVIPLPYQDGGGDASAAFRTLTRGVAWMLVLRGGYTLAVWGMTVACRAWQTTAAVPALRDVIPSTPIVVGLPSTCVTAGLLAAAGACLRWREAGRRWVARLAAVEGFVAPVTYLANGAYYHVTRQHLRYGAAYATYMGGQYVLGAAYAVGLSAAVWMFFRHPAVRRMFADP